MVKNELALHESKLGFLWFPKMIRKGVVKIRDVEAEAEAGSGGSGPFSVKAEAEARKFYRSRFHIGYLT